MHADTVIVGAGSAGAVIAARATERSDRQVLLLEAGPDYPVALALPADLRDGTRNSMTSHDWGYMHRPAPGSAIPLEFPRGRVVGGSSAVNTCIAIRGQPYDYDEWAARGLPEWSFAACLPAFKRLEDDLDFVNQWHGQGGPIPIRRHPPSELGPWQAAFLEACAVLGFPASNDTNDPTTAGYGPHAMNKVGGVRISAARGYLTPSVRARDNLTILARTLVRRVRLSGRRVTGVEVDTDGRVHEISTRRVILAAGAIATPGILLRSGIGPRRTLERLGVDLVADVPAIGARLLDHPGSAIFLRPKHTRGTSLIQTVLRYTSEGSDCPNDMQLQPGSFVPLPRVTLPLVSLACVVGKPRSHGVLEFRSAHPREVPRIHSNFFAHPQDRARAVAGIELAFRIAETAPMRALATPFLPWRSVLLRRERIDQWLPRISGSGYHPCGTAPMGPESDPTAAVDGRGRVRGVEGLVVADASIMPEIPMANTNLTTLMIGERFGEWLRDGGLV